MRGARISFGAATILGTLIWVLLGERLREPPLQFETTHSLRGEPGLRLITERSEFMRSER